MRTGLIIFAILLLCSSVTMAAKSGPYVTPDGHTINIGISCEPEIPSYGQNGQRWTARVTGTATDENGAVPGVAISVSCLSRPYNKMKDTNSEGHMLFDISAPQPPLMSTANIRVFANGVEVFTWTPKVSMLLPQTNMIYSGTISGSGNVIGRSFILNVDGHAVCSIDSGYSGTRVVTGPEALVVRAETEILSGNIGEVEASTCGGSASGSQSSGMEIVWGTRPGILPSKLHWNRWANPSISLTGQANLGSGSVTGSVCITDLPAANCSASLVAQSTQTYNTDTKSISDRKIISGSTPSVGGGLSAAAILVGFLSGEEGIRGVHLENIVNGGYGQSVDIYTVDFVE